MGGSEVRIKKLDPFTLEMSKNHLICNFLRNGRLRVNLILFEVRGKNYHNIIKDLFKPQAPVAQKIAEEVVFRRFQGEGVEFFQIGPH